MNLPDAIECKNPDCRNIVCDPLPRADDVYWRLYLRNVDVRLVSHATEVQGRCRFCNFMQKHSLPFPLNTPS